jgi:hypothetical protein
MKSHHDTPSRKSKDALVSETTLLENASGGKSQPWTLLKSPPSTRVTFKELRDILSEADKA